MRERAAVYLSVFLVGFCGLVAQVVLLREMVVTFYGNELSIGVMLGAWLFWTGLGSFGLGRVAHRLKRPEIWLAGALLLAAVVVVATVLGARCLKMLVGLSGRAYAEFFAHPVRAVRDLGAFAAEPGGTLARLAAAREAPLGQMRPFGLMLVSSLLLLGPFCLLNGLLFPLACRAAACTGGDAGAGSRETGAGLAYLLEAAGAALGGVCYTFLFAGVLADALDPVRLAWGGLLVYAGCSLCLGVARWRWRSAKAIAVVAGIFFCAAWAVSEASWFDAVRWATERAYWQPLDLVSTADSRYGRVAVVRQSAATVQRSLYENGALAFSSPDPPAAEAVAHLPMLQHPDPRSVLLLGGGLGGVIEEILKHPSVKKLTYVELDPLVLAAVRKDFPEAAKQALADPRVELVLGDGRAFLLRSRERYDIVISAPGSPTTAQANRYFTLEFFRQAARALRPGGVFSFRASGGETYISETNRRLLACLHRTLSEAFPQVLVFPGAQCTFLSSDGTRELTYMPDVLEDRLLGRGVKTSYVDASVWEAALAGGRVEDLKDALRVSPPPALNLDLSPRCYYFEAQRWGEEQRTRRARGREPWLDLGRLLLYLDDRPLVAPIALVGLLAVVSMPIPLLRRRWSDAAVSLAVVSSGFIQMAVEFLLLLGFQVVHGYVYQVLGVIMGAFMLGMTLGAWLSSGWVRQGRGTWRRLKWVQVCTTAYPLILLGFLVFASRVGLGQLPALAGLSFGLMAILAGSTAGLLFPLAVTLHRGGGTSAGVLYGLDLFGACLGALAVSSILVPISGLSWVCVMLAALGGLGLVGLLAAGGKGGAKSS